MFKFLFGVITGVYIAQSNKETIPDITCYIDGIIKDIKYKCNEYTNQNSSKDK